MAMPQRWVANALGGRRVHRRVAVLSCLTRFTATTLFAATAFGIVQLGVCSPAHAAGAYKLQGKGLDSCAAPSTTKMADFWSGTPYWYWGIYIGGSQRACSQPNLTSSWINTVMSGSTMNWRLLPLWVGRQDPCQPGFGSYISLNTSTAYNQGKAEAGSAYLTWTSTLGQSSSTPIVYDMEYTGGTITSSCLAAMKSFINGWVYQLHLAPAQKAGVYTSACAKLDAFSTIANVPDFIDAADWDGDSHTSNISCVPSNHWIYQQRHKQYRGSHNETWNGSTINVDSRCANSWTYATDAINADSSCS